MPFTHPVLSTACSFILAAVVVLLTERLALPPAARAAAAVARPAGAARCAGDLAARLAAILVIFLAFFAISWRPLYAFAATVSFFVIFTGISRVKFNDIREPLVFSDIALVLLLFRHKELFRASWLGVGAMAAALAYVFGASALFYVYEPPILPASGRLGAILAGILVAAAPWLLLTAAPARRAASRLAAAVTGRDDIAALTVRLGAFGAVLYGFLAWLGERPHPKPAVPSPGMAGDTGERPLLIVWQSESFVDMRHHGVPVSLPNLDALRRRAVAWGRMASIFEGGYTLRTEFAVLSGMPPQDLGPDASHPYLRAGAYSDIAWPSRLRRAGWATHFIHPFDPVFFSRDRALPKLGFDTLTMLDAFDHDPSRDGPYVSDLDLSRRVLALCEGDAGTAGQLIFAASMENHGPWQPGRDGEKTDPLDIYVGLLERSDCALGFLAEALDRMKRPVWLIFYGDHAPILKSFADPFPDPRTDYAIVPLGTARAGEAPVSAQEKAPWHLIAATVSHMAASGADLRPE
jgi:hypothetical protein